MLQAPMLDGLAFDVGPFTQDAGDPNDLFPETLLCDPAVVP